MRRSGGRAAKRAENCSCTACRAGLIGGGVGGVVRLMGQVNLYQPLGDIIDIDQHIGRIIPGMRVYRAVMMIFIIMSMGLFLLFFPLRFLQGCVLVRSYSFTPTIPKAAG